MLHVPVLRGGKPYRSIDLLDVADIGTSDVRVQVSQANAGLIARDMLAAAERRRVLTEKPISELLEIFKKAAQLFVEGELPLDPAEGTTLGPEEYVARQSATTGMPRSMCRANMEKIRFVMAEMEMVLGGLTRGLDLEVLDAGWAEQDGRFVSYAPEADSLGAVLPSNSPGVHSLWLPAIALKVPVVLKPGRQEPWTPQRVSQALIAAGCPAEAFSFYPCDYSGAAQVLLKTDRSMLFGDASTVRGWAKDRRVQLHGPGWSKVLLGADLCDDWTRHVDLMAASVAGNGGRSCLNASGIWTHAHGRKIAEALAAKLVKIEARGLNDPDAEIAAFFDGRVAHKISEHIDRLLEQPGAVDLTAELRDGDRVVEIDGCTFLLPTVLWIEDPGHPLTGSEFMFPFVSVVECPQDEMIDGICTTLVATALTKDRKFIGELMAARNIDRLNIGEVPTGMVSWDQPHEGNLFEHLYRQRAFQRAG